MILMKGLKNSCSVLHIEKFAMIPVTAQKIEKLIKEAEEAGIPEAELQELREDLDDIKHGRVMKPIATGLTHKEVISHGKRVVRVSTAPIPPDDSLDEDEFEGVTFKPVKRRSTN